MCFLRFSFGSWLCSVIIIAVLVFLVPLYMRERKDEHLGEWRSEEDLGGVGGGKTVIRI